MIWVCGSRVAGVVLRIWGLGLAGLLFACFGLFWFEGLGLLHLPKPSLLQFVDSG